MEQTAVQAYIPPTVAELFEQSDSLQTAYANDQFNAILSTHPPASWVKEHPYIKVETVDERGNKIKVPYKYLPIEKVEFLLRKIFKAYKIEILKSGSAFNGVEVTVRVHYFSPAVGEWMFHDGIGAIQLQTAKGTSPADLANINNGALSMAFPLAKTLAIKDACDMFGNLFGANLNRRDVLQNTPDPKLTETYNTAEYKRRVELINACADVASLEKLREDALGYDLMDLYNQKYAELR
jgi:hypothetical protein